MTGDLFLRNEEATGSIPVSSTKSLNHLARPILSGIPDTQSHWSVEKESRFITGEGAPRRGRMSAAGRARIAAAQRARWAKVKGPKIVSITVRKRTMSPGARRRIAAAQKARWAKWRKAQKKG